MQRRLRRLRQTNALHHSGFTLIEYIAATVIAALLLVGGAVLLDSALRMGVSAAQAGTVQVSAQQLLGQAVNELGNAQPLGYCDKYFNSAPTTSSSSFDPFGIPYQLCQHPEPTGSSLYSASTDGVCFYTYEYLDVSETANGFYSNGQNPLTQNVLQNDAPYLECIVVEPQSANHNGLYLVYWKPQNGDNGAPSYTNCNPGPPLSNTGPNCWGVSAGGIDQASRGPFAQTGHTAIPIPFDSCTWGTTCAAAYYLGTVAQPAAGQAWFSFFKNNSAASPVDPASLACTANVSSCLNSISMVKLNIDVTNASHSNIAGVGTTQFSMNYLAILRGSAVANSSIYGTTS